MLYEERFNIMAAYGIIIIFNITIAYMRSLIFKWTGLFSDFHFGMDAANMVRGTFGV